MTRKHHNITSPEEQPTTPSDGELKAEGKAPLEESGASIDASASTERAGLEPSPGPAGQPDPMAQAKISTAGGLRSNGDLVSELSALPPIGALDGLRANAQTGYYKTVPAAQLVADLEGLNFETDEQKAVRDALIERAKSGAFSGPS